MGKFRHTFANSENPEENESSNEDFHCLLSLFNFHSNKSKMKETMSLSKFRRLSKFTRLYPILANTEDPDEMSREVTFIRVCTVF